MEQIIEAGDTLEIEDAEGQKFAVTATECQATLEFCKAFDVWLTMRKSGIEGFTISGAFANVVDAFNKLPLRIQRELPSWKTLGASV